MSEHRQNNYPNHKSKPNIPYPNKWMTTFVLLITALASLRLLYREDVLAYSLIKLPPLLDSIQFRAKAHFLKLSPNHLIEALIVWYIFPLTEMPPVPQAAQYPLTANFLDSEWDSGVWLQGHWHHEKPKTYIVKCQIVCILLLLLMLFNIQKFRLKVTAQTLACRHCVNEWFGVDKS